MADESGYIRSPISDIDGIFGDDIHCSWTLIAGNDEVVKLEILFLRTPGVPHSIASCRHDLTVYFLEFVTDLKRHILCDLYSGNRFVVLQFLRHPVQSNVYFFRLSSFAIVLDFKLSVSVFRLLSSYQHHYL